MASERSTERLLDLLYDELSAEEALSVRKEIEESEELRSEYETLQGMLARIEESMPLEDPPASVHMSIMDAAREAATSNVEDEVRAVRRTPGQAAAGRGFWGRLSGSQFSQVALVATVLLAGAFMFKVIGFDQAPESAMSRLEERPMPGAMMSNEPPAAPADEPVEAAKAEETEAEGEFANRESRRGVGGEGAGLMEGDGVADRDERSPLLAKDNPAGDKASAEAPSRAQVEEKKQRQEVAAPAPRPKPVTSTPSKKSSTRSSKSVKSKKSDDVLLDSLSAVDDGASSFKGSTSNATSGAAQQPSAPRQEEAPLEVQAPAAAEAEPTLGAKEDAEKDAYRPSSGTLEAVEAYYSAGDYRQTVSEADRVLGTSAPPAQKSRALELKAQAYRRMDMLSQADAIYRNMQRNYPDYAPARVKEAREEINRILSQKRERPKRKAAPKRSYDFEAEEMSPTLE